MLGVGIFSILLPVIISPQPLIAKRRLCLLQWDKIEILSIDWKLEPGRIRIKECEKVQRERKMTT